MSEISFKGAEAEWRSWQGWAWAMGLVDLSFQKSLDVFMFSSWPVLVFELFLLTSYLASFWPVCASLTGVRMQGPWCQTQMRRNRITGLRNPIPVRHTGCLKPSCWFADLLSPFLFGQCLPLLGFLEVTMSSSPSSISWNLLEKVLRPETCERMLF